MDKMLLIDIETQSFPVETGMYEVACLVVENYEIVDQLYLGKEIKGYKGSRSYGFGFHDISQDEEYKNRFRQFVKKYPYPIVAHNCPFDRKFLVYYQWITEDYPTYCSMRAIRLTDGTLESYALQRLVKNFQISNKNVEHTAMADIKMVYELLRMLKPHNWIPVGTKVRKSTFYDRKIKARALEDIDLDIETTAILEGENICFTGKSYYSRNTMEEIAIKNGATKSSNITSKTTMLVVGLEAGSKLDKAQERGLSIISDEDFMKMLNLTDKQIV